jgi:hypothetical protein
MAIGLFEDSAAADNVVAHLLECGFSRDEVRLVRRSDFDGTSGPETDILKIGGLPREHAGKYWEAVRHGRVLVSVTSVETRRIGQPASWAGMGRSTWKSTKLRRWRAAAAHRSVR